MIFIYFLFFLGFVFCLFSASFNRCPSRRRNSLYKVVSTIVFEWSRAGVIRPLLLNISSTLAPVSGFARVLRLRWVPFRPPSFQPPSSTALVVSLGDHWCNLCFRYLDAVYLGLACEWARQRNMGKPCKANYYAP